MTPVNQHRPAKRKRVTDVTDKDATASPTHMLSLPTHFIPPLTTTAFASVSSSAAPAAQPPAPAVQPKQKEIEVIDLDADSDDEQEQTLAPPAQPSSPGPPPAPPPSPIPASQSELLLPSAHQHNPHLISDAQSLQPQPPALHAGELQAQQQQLFQPPPQPRPPPLPNDSSIEVINLDDDDDDGNAINNFNVNTVTKSVAEDEKGGPSVETDDAIEILDSDEEDQLRLRNNSNPTLTTNPPSIVTAAEVNPKPNPTTAADAAVAQNNTNIVPSSQIPAAPAPNITPAVAPAFGMNYPPQVSNVQPVSSASTVQPPLIVPGTVPGTVAAPALTVTNQAQSSNPSHVLPTENLSVNPATAPLSNITQIGATQNKHFYIRYPQYAGSGQVKWVWLLRPDVDKSNGVPPPPSEPAEPKAIPPPPPRLIPVLPRTVFNQPGIVPNPVPNINQNPLPVVVGQMPNFTSVSPVAPQFVTPISTTGAPYFLNPPPVPPVPLHPGSSLAASSYSLATIPPREREVGGLTEEGLRALVKQHGLTADAEIEAETPPEMTIKLMPHQRRALEWMSKRERPMDLGEEVIAADDECLGGILADEQGLGKTLTMIAVMVKNVPQLAYKNGVRMLDDRPITEEDHIHRKTKGVSWRTLVVCPLSLMHQWRQEIVTNMRKDRIPSVYIYHGQKRDRCARVLRRYDVVITTYTTLAHEYPKVLKDLQENQLRKKQNLKLLTKKPGPLFRVKWRRAVLDEAHFVKNRNTDSWKAVMELKADTRWCLTGTPIANSVDDIYSLFCFVRYKFVPNYEMWNQHWKKVLESNHADVRKRAFKRFQTVCGVVCLRRTKKDTINGRPLLSLPKRLVHLIECEFDNEEERVAYDNARLASMQQLRKQMDDNNRLVNYSSVLVVLLRLRQACCHPFLETYSRMFSQTDGNNTQNRGFETPYSDEELEEAMELVENQQAMTDLLNDNARSRVELMLRPPERKDVNRDSVGDVIWSPFKCGACGVETAWEEGVFFPCGDQFCNKCCAKSRQEGRCILCFVEVNPEQFGSELNANELRQEVHAKTLSAYNEVGFADGVTGREMRAWIREQLDHQNAVNKKLRKKYNKEVGNANSDADNAQKRADAIDLDDCDEEPLDDEDLIDDVNDDDDDDDDDNDEDEKGKASSSQPNMLDDDRKKRLFEAFAKPSTKVKRIVERVNHVRDTDKGEKVLVFSQWTTMLDVVEYHLCMAGHNSRRLDGAMSITNREEQIDEFRQFPEVNVLLVSLRSGGTGLNLTVASHVILADVWWNPTVEDQAIDRVHRIGQHRTVHVTRFKMKSTVEERIYSICERKREQVSNSLGETSSASLGRQKLSMTELMSIFREEAVQARTMAVPGSAAAEAVDNILRMSGGLGAGRGNA